MSSDKESPLILVLMDEFYEHHGKLVVTASAPMVSLYHGVVAALKVKVPVLLVAFAGNTE